MNPTEFVKKTGPELFGDYICFSALALFFVFLFCPVSLLFAALWSWKLPFQQHWQHFGVRTSHFPLYLQHVDARTVYVAWYFAPRIHLGWFRFGLGFI